MPFTALPFDTLPWQPGNHPLEEKKLGDVEGVVLLRFAPGFEDPNLCTADHVLSVFSGELTLGLERGDVTLRAGQSCALTSGTAHRAKNLGDEPVVLLAVSAPLLSS